MPSSPHDLLPWYVNGTLGTDEERAFRRHLEGCADCRAEVEAARKVSAELEEHGAVLLEGHPSAEELVAAVRGESETEEAEKVRRHLELCKPCALEARWARGEEAAGESPVLPLPVRTSIGKREIFAWATAVAAVLALFWILPSQLGISPRQGVSRPVQIMPVERGMDDRNTFSVSPREAGLLLMFEVDLPKVAFPVELEILDPSGNLVRSQPTLEFDYLVDELYLFIDLDREECRPGDYSVRITPSSGETAPLAFAFTIESR